GTVSRFDPSDDTDRRRLRGDWTVAVRTRTRGCRGVAAGVLKSVRLRTGTAWYARWLPSADTNPGTGAACARPLAECGGRPSGRSVGRGRVADGAPNNPPASVYTSMTAASLCRSPSNLTIPTAA